MHSRWAAAGLLAALQVLPPALAASAPARSAASLATLSIEELAEIEVSSVSKRPERLAAAPAAAYVITRDDLRRAGVNTLAEALRLAPNLQVAKSRSHSHAVTARGFNGTSANKLLVLIDGRTVYTPLHSGVFWDAQDVMLLDVERIEVVSGPGGTLWGANAVNGVINIITRSAHETTGTMAHVSAGNETRGAVLRHGWRFREGASVRVYARSFNFDNSERSDGTDVDDEWRRRQAGFRADWGSHSATWTFQGDFQDGHARVPGQVDRKVDGANLLVRHQREIAEKSGVQTQVYFDSYRRQQPGFFSQRLETLDIDVQHQFAIGAHEVVWGGGHREHHDRTEGGALLAFVPAQAKLRLTNVFVQDTMPLGGNAKLTLGLKAERNSYTGLEVQPSVRLAWKPSNQVLAWTAVSRAVRTPSRLDRDFLVFVNLGAPYSGRLLGGPDFQSERLVAYEAGLRMQPTARSSLSVSAYVNEYEGLRSVEPDGTGNFVLGNGVDARTHGLEAWGSLQVHDDWRLHAGANLLRQKFRFNPASRDPGSAEAGVNDPKHQWMLRSNWSPRDDLSIDVSLRRVGALPHPVVPAYTALDARVGWWVRENLEVSLAGFNLQGGRHAEFGAESGRSEFGPQVLLRLTWVMP